MAADEFDIPTVATDWLRSMGYDPYVSMASDVERWWGWYTASDAWYSPDRYDFVGRRKYTAHRHTIHPARRVCREWASLMFDDGTQASCTGEAPTANAWLESWMGRTGFLSVGQRCSERAFALGTGAIALWFDVPADGSRPVTMRPRRYDARMIVPISWDDEGTTECAFVTNAHAGGHRVTQAQAHVLSPETGTYHILTRMWDEMGDAVASTSINPDIDTGSARQTFTIVRPAVDNVLADMSPFGQSVFEDATDAVMAVDDAFDTIIRELDVTKPKVFMDDALIGVTDDDGHVVALPMAPEETVIRSVAGRSATDVLQTFQPAIRATELRTMLDTALAELGDLTGFGQQYFTLDRQGGLKTATEVSADNAALMRNIRKHEQLIGQSLSQMLGAAVTCARTMCEQPVEEDFGEVEVTWDDSIIEDTPAVKAQAQAEMAAGIMSPWEYRARFYGEDEATARDRAAEAQGGTITVSPMGDPSKSFEV